MVVMIIQLPPPRFTCNTHMMTTKKRHSTEGKGCHVPRYADRKGAPLLVSTLGQKSLRVIFIRLWTQVTIRAGVTIYISLEVFHAPLKSLGAHSAFHIGVASHHTLRLLYLRMVLISIMHVLRTTYVWLPILRYALVLKSRGLGLH